MEHLALLRIETPEGPDSDCPPDTVWFEIAAGINTQDSESHLSHAVNCDHCGPMLKEAVADLADELTSEEDAQIAGLGSSNPAWQRRIAIRMRGATTSFSIEGAQKLTFVQRLRQTPVWIALPGAAALLLAAVLGGIGLWRVEHPSDARLLALAYNKQRTLVLRIPGGDPVPLASGTRGSSNGLTEPSELLELRLRARQHLDQIPDSPYWHQILGQVELIEGDGVAARRDLEIAQASGASLPNLQSDLAGAWFEIGEKTGNAESYAEAAEIYGELLNDRPVDPALLHYNRAICWERQSLTENAVADLRAALSEEHSAKWRKAIEAEITRLSSHSEAIATDGYETALNDATEKLLPHWSDSEPARKTISRVAELGHHHRDNWLFDWIEATHHIAAQNADQHLATAVTAGSAGDAGVSLIESRKAELLYAAAGHAPGLLRAQIAEIYALQRLDRATECLGIAKKLGREPQLRNYAWIQTQLAIEIGNCNSLVGSLAAEQQAFERAVLLSKASDLPILNLRALGAQASLDNFRGATIAGWQIDVAGLFLCAKNHCPPIHDYKFLYNMVSGAQDLGLHHVAVEVMRTAEAVASTTGDVTAHAYALETFAKLAGEVGDFHESMRAFDAASNLARANNQAVMVKLYQAEWRNDRAQELMEQGRAGEALELLEQSAPEILASDYQYGRVNYYTQLSIAQRSLELNDDALASASAAVRESEFSLSRLRSTLERQQWSRENVATYTELVQDYLQRGDSSAALQVWERYRSAPFADVPSLVMSGISRDLVHANRESSDATYVVIIALIGEKYVGWLAQANPLKAIRTVDLGDRSRLNRASTAFYRLCADRDSNLNDIRSLGTSLYKVLLGPFGDEIGSSRHLWIDIDPSLGLVPLSALTLPSGTWLGNAARITFLPPWWSIRPRSVFGDPFVSSAMHVVVLSGFGDLKRDGLRGGYSEASEVAALFPNSTLIDGSSTTPNEALHSMASAEVFHFSGHAAGSSESHLLLSPEEDREGPTALHWLDPETVGSNRFPHCRVAVLAACNTSDADPDQLERLPNLRNALLLSGAHSVIASKWDVDDSCTRSLMLAFYKQLISGKPVTQALQSAQQSVRSSTAWRHPFFWASFEVFNN
jgi:CHAT domain-containing protein